MDEKESKRLQAEAIRLAEVLWAGRDDDTSRLLREGARAMRERDELLRCPFITHCQHQEQGEGAMDLRKRHDDLDRRAMQATAAEERALADFTGAIEEVRGKLCRAAGMPSEMTWEQLVPAVEALRTNLDRTSAELDCAVSQVEDAEQDRDKGREAHELARAAQDRIAEQGQELDQLRGSLSRANEERDSILMALKTVRDVIIESDHLLVDALGGEPTKDAEYASDLLDNVKALIARLGDERETWGTERGALKAEIARLNKDVAGYRQGDETLASSWKGHVWRLAAALGVPRPVMGRATDPSVDQIMQYINQNVLPMVEVSKRVDAIEQRLSPKITCKHCGAKYLVGVEFCPSCGKEETPPKAPQYEEEAVLADPKFAMRNKAPEES